ncbi:MAG: hypothetical protein K2N23_05815 [Clostridia bacterium]|nr:hypothetical protein [Clostridia bacterium]
MQNTKCEKIKNALNIGGIALILLAALTALVFVFVCGVSAVTHVDGMKVSATTMLYDYFGNAYSGIEDTRDTIASAIDVSDIGAAREFAIYFPIILGTVVSAVGLLGVVALAILTAVNAYKKYCKNQEVNVIAPAVATYLVFATFATLLLCLVSAEASGMKTVFSAPTRAGLITGGVLLGAGALLIGGANFEKFKGIDVKAGAIAAVAVSAFTAVILGLLALPAAGAVSTGVSYGEITIKRVYNGLFIGMQSTLLTVSDDEAFFEVLAYALIGGVAAVAAGVISAVTLFRKIPAVCEGKNKSNIVLCSVVAGLALVYLVFTILFANKMYEDADADLTKDFAVPIMVAVAAVLALVAEVVGKVLFKAKTEAAEEVPQEAPAQAE